MLSKFEEEFKPVSPFEIKDLENDFIKTFDIQDDNSETAYFTGTIKPDIDLHLMDLILLSTRTSGMNISWCYTEKELKDSLLEEFIYNFSTDLKNEILKIFNPWRF